MRRPVNVQGASASLAVTSLTSSCGAVTQHRGIAFEFGNNGPWVIDVAELEQICADARQAQLELLAIENNVADSIAEYLKSCDDYEVPSAAIDALHTGRWRYG